MHGMYITEISNERKGFLFGMSFFKFCSYSLKLVEFLVFMSFNG